MDYSENIRKALLEARNALDEFLADAERIRKINEAARGMIQCLKSSHKIISCGNGGSMCDAMHFAEEMTGRFREDRKPYAALSISDPSYLTCVGNDYGFKYAFSRFIEAHGKSGDVLLAISTSGNSENVIEAIRAGKEKGLTIVGLTGRDGGKMAGLCDVEIRAPLSVYADRAQEIHIKVIHLLIECIEAGMS
jgi:D-sedoheptulose 7-phosphate isomerase